MGIPGKPVYRCRLCGQVIVSPEPIGDIDTTLSSLEFHLFRDPRAMESLGDMCHKPMMAIRHVNGCKDGFVGIAEIIGVQIGA